MYDHEWRSQKKDNFAVDICIDSSQLYIKYLDKAVIRWWHLYKYQSSTVGQLLSDCLKYSSSVWYNDLNPLKENLPS